MQNIWDRIGIGFLSIFSGLIYSLVFYCLVFVFYKELDFINTIGLFCTVFGVAGVILGDRMSDAIENTYIAIYFLWGFVLGVLVSGGGYTGDLPDIKKPILRQVVWLGLLAAIVGAIGIMF